VPEGNVEEVMVRAAGAMEMERVIDLFWVGFDESATVAVKLAFPTAAGVPEIAPVAFRLSPAGRSPEMKDQVYGAVPPLACKEVE
jgi:hypothetical protein